MATSTSIVTGTCHEGDTEATDGSIAKAINEVTTAAAKVVSVSVMVSSGGLCTAVAVIVWEAA